MEISSSRCVSGQLRDCNILKELVCNYGYLTGVSKGAVSEKQTQTLEGFMVITLFM